MIFQPNSTAVTAVAATAALAAFLVGSAAWTATHLAWPLPAAGVPAAGAAQPPISRPAAPDAHPAPPAPAAEDAAQAVGAAAGSTALPANWHAPALGPQQYAALAAAGPATPDAVLAYLARTGRQLLSVEAGAITGPGRAELLLVGSGVGCASCRPRWIAVWDVARQAPLWQTADGDGSDTSASIVGGGAGFVRTDPVRQPDEASCCPARWESRLLEWDGAAFAVRSVSDPLQELGGTPARARA